jgi:hypothetical protein
LTVKRVGDLDIDQDMAFSRKEWKVQYVGWLVMALVIAGGLLGAFGTGPLAEGSVGSARDPLSFTYQRIDRQERPTALDITIGPEATQGGQVEIWFDNAFLDRIQGQTFLPEPESVQAGANRTVFVFDVDDPEQPAQVTMGFQHDGMGRVQGRLGLVNGQERTFTIYVYP